MTHMNAGCYKINAAFYFLARTTLQLVFEIVNDEKQMIATPLGNKMKSEDVLVDTFLEICYTSK